MTADLLLRTRSYSGGIERERDGDGDGMRVSKALVVFCLVMVFL